MRKKTIDTYYDHHPSAEEIRECVTYAAELGLVTRFRTVAVSDYDQLRGSGRQWIVRVDYTPKGDQR